MEAKELGQFIAAIRKEKQITQAELAKRLNVTDKAVSRWERGLGFPDINTLEPLADALGVTLTELMTCKRQAADEEHGEGAETVGVYGRLQADTDSGIIASIEIAKLQRKKALKRIVAGIIMLFAGVLLAYYAVNLFMTHQWTLMISGNDGPTSVFVAGRIGNFWPSLILIAGIILLAAGIYAIVRSGNNDK